MSMILIVDDDAMTLKLLDHTLVGGGHGVVATANPEEAALLAAAHQVDAVILDVMMPGRSGFEVLRDLHANAETRRLPVLMLSCLSEVEDRVKGLRGGADEYIGKPFDPEELLLRLNRLIDGRLSQRSEFLGRLETLSFAEVIQSLLHSDTHGVLEIGSGDRRGELVVISGRSIGASWGRLEGIEAVLAMMDLKTGTFRFSGSVLSEAAVTKGSEIPIQKTMFTAAWLIDELSRWPEVSEDAVLSAQPGIQADPVPEADWSSMPVEEILNEILSNPGITIQELVKIERWSPRKVDLVVRYLVQGGLVGAERSSALGEGGDGEVEVNCGVAVKAVLNAVRRHGFSAELPHVLILVEPMVYGAFLEARQALPAENLAVSGESMAAAWRGGRIATLALRTAGAGLVLHVVSLESTQALKQIRARMADYPTVMVWVADPARIDDVGWLLEWVETAPTSQWGYIVASSEEAAERATQALQWKKRWHLHSDPISGIEDLLCIIAED
jgi:CheY-like chemotaxis protein